MKSRGEVLTLVTIAAVVFIVDVIGHVVFKAVRAYSAEESVLPPETGEIAARAKKEYARQVPLSFLNMRFVVTSVEPCSQERAYLLTLDVYRWLGGKGRGFVRYTTDEGAVGGGTISAEEDGSELLAEFHTWCIER